MSVEALRALLPACATRGIPMLVANPDVVTVDAEMLVPMPGMLAQARPMPDISASMCHSAVPVQSCSATCDVLLKLQQQRGHRAIHYVHAVGSCA